MFVKDRLSSGVRPDQICEDLLDACISPDCLMGGIGCDNMTVIIVTFPDTSKQVEKVDLK